MPKRESTYLLIVWTVVSTAIFLIGVGFAGGVDNIFVIPLDTGIVEFLLWVAVWIFVIAPFAWLLLRGLCKLKQIIAR